MLPGTVVDFDEHVGLGHVVSSTGDVHLFHCVEIADGSRSIDVGAAVEFDVVRKLGALEARTVRRRA